MGLWHWAFTEQHLSTQGRETCSKFPYASDLGRQWSLWYGFGGPNLRNLRTASQYKLQSSKYSTRPMLLPLLFEHPGQLFWNESLRRFCTIRKGQLQEEKMATHSSVLAWRIPRTGEPGGLLSMVLHRVRHDWHDLAVAAVADLSYPRNIDCW